MKKKILVSLINGLALFGQTPQQFNNVGAINWSVPTLAPVSNIGVSIQGISGNATYYYWVVANYAAGNAIVSPFTTIYFASDTLRGGNCNVVSWPSTGAITYDVLRTSTSTLPNTPANILVGNTASLTISDCSNSLSSYTLNPATNSNCNWSISANGSINAPCLTGLPTTLTTQTNSVNNANQNVLNLINGLDNIGFTPTIFNTGGGTVKFGLTIDSQNPNTFFAGPSSGGISNPTWRVLTNSDIPNPLNAPNVNNVVKVDGQPSSCTYNATSYTTQAQCANQAALALLTSQQSNVTMEFGSAGIYPTCGAIYLSDAVGTFVINLKGQGRSWQQGLYSATHLKQTCTDTRSAPATVYKPIGTVTYTWPNLTIEGMEIDPNDYANAAMELYGVSGTGINNQYDAPLASQDHFVKIGNNPNTAQGGAYEWVSINEKVVGPYIGQAAQYTPIVTTGAITGYTQVSQGSNYSCASGATVIRLLTYTGGTLPTAPIASCSGGKITGLTGGTGGSGLTSADIQILDIYPTTYGYVNNATASTIIGLVIKNAGQSSGYIENSGHNHLMHVHPQGIAVGLYLNAGGSTVEHTECDTNSVCIYNNGTYYRFVGTENYFNPVVAPALPGSTTFFLGSGYGGYMSSIGTRSGYGTSGADFHEYTNSSGALNPTQTGINVGSSVGDEGDSTSGSMGGFFDSPVYFGNVTNTIPLGVATSGANFNSNKLGVCSSYWTIGSASQQDCWNFQAGFNTGSGTPSRGVLNISESNTTGTSIINLTGTVGAFSFNSDTSISRTAAGEITAGTGGAQNTGGAFKAAFYRTSTNCAVVTGVSPAACAVAPAGYVVIPAAATTYTVNTTAVTANSRFWFSVNSHSASCTGTAPTNIATFTLPRVTTVTAGVSFVMTFDNAPLVNGLCIDYGFIN